MRHGSLIGAVLFVLAGCPGGDAGLGERCGSHSDCAGQLQCFANICQPRCERAPDCGDGYRCDNDGVCIAATGQLGDTCKSEVECAAGLSCQIEGTELADDGFLLASCVVENSSHPAGAECQTSGDCRNGTCDLGHCIDLCGSDRDCGTGTMCTQIPRLIGTFSNQIQVQYRGCLQSQGAVRWSIPVTSANDEIELPVPSSARSVSMLFTVDDPNQKVGATAVTIPGVDTCGQTLCDVMTMYDYYANPFVRHRTEFGASVLSMPISPAPPAQLRTGVYTMRVKSLRQTDPVTCQTPPCFGQGTATPAVTAVIKVDEAAILDLHFYFLNLDDHPCGDAFGGKLDAATAQGASYFEQYLGEIKNIIGNAVYFEVGNVTYEDLRDHADLDGLDVDNAASLLALGKHATGINVFFVRTLSPIGLQAVGPNPGPAALGGTPRSGIVIGVDTLCYRSWTQLARLTTREIARYMGLYDNTGLDPMQNDPIADTDMSSVNLMFYSELGGTYLSDGQRQILRRSAVLR
ncbi:MAG TPA: hypothetical protein VFV99_13020 [Kofleriaceae bacterium]|nr:hypothetical protein [Kofleriaceae bacterium]